MTNTKDAAGLIALGAVLAAALALSGGPSTAQRRDLGILGRRAPEWHIRSWIDAGGKPAKIRLKDYKGKVVYLLCFQDW